MPYFNICSHCGARLDPGEVCDCQKIQANHIAKQRKGGATVEEAITAVERLSSEERAELLALLTSKHGDEVSHILHRNGWE